MKTLKDVNLEGKKVLVVCGFNVPIEDGEIKDDKKIRAGLETVEYIKEQGASKIMMVCHLGRPGGKVVPELSNRPVAKRLGELIEEKVHFLEDVDDVSSWVSEETLQGEVCFFENVRFWPGEEENDDEFSKKVAEGFDVYVNDGFSYSHRAHASIVSFPKFIKERCAGFLFEKELSNLEKVRNNPEHPAVMVIGGAKIETKLPVIENLKDTYDKILVGGLIANEAIDQKTDFDEKVVLPVDFAPAGKEGERLDIGPETIEKFEAEIAKAKTIVWNGPMGKYEEAESAEGSKRIMQAVAKNVDAYQVIGGGETLDVIDEFGDFSDFDYVSMSGGAMLEFLAGKELPGIAALEE